METKLDLRLAQKLIMTPQLQQAIKLLQLSKLELEQIINQELMENPVLEETASETLDAEDEDNFKSSQLSDISNAAVEKDAENIAPLEGSGSDMKWEDYLDDDRGENRELSFRKEVDEESPGYEQILTKPASLYDHLIWQLKLSTSDNLVSDIGELIIGNLDENGYFQSTVEEIACQSNTSTNKVFEVLKFIQNFDPPGVAARDLKECLLNQIVQIGFSGTIVETIVSDHLSDFEKKRYQVIARKLDISLEDLSHAIRIIERLEPKPGRSFYTTDNTYIVPDVYVIKHEGEYIVLMNEEGLPKLKINPVYKKMLKGKNEIDADERGYLEDKFRSAIWMIRSIEQRNRTIYKVAQSIVKYQTDFFDKGVNQLKPLTLREIAEDIQMHESTVSRVTHNKYVGTPQGIFELKYFFSSGLGTSGGENCSSRSVRDMIEKLISDESPKKPFSDQQIMEYLKQKQIEIARRTVAKYRKELKIPSASRRRKLVI